MNLISKLSHFLLGPAAAQVSKERRLRKRIDAMHNAGYGLSPVAYAMKSAALLDLLPRPFTALEPFGMCGLRKTLDYINLCDSLDFFEINSAFSRVAQSRLPNATVYCQDSIAAINNGTVPRLNYSFVLIDNPAGVFGEYCEHFDLFPALYNMLADDSLLLYNVQLDGWIDVGSQPVHNRRRRAFYRGPLENARGAIAFYERLAKLSGFDTTFSSVVPHPGNMLFVLQCLRRSNDPKES